MENNNFIPPPIYQPTNPNNTMNPTQGEPKRKRVQVSAACLQCKRAHAACSNTRPCDRCVRINQAAACIAGAAGPASHAHTHAQGGNAVPSPVAHSIPVLPSTPTTVNMGPGTTRPVVKTGYANIHGDVSLSTIPVVGSPMIFNEQDISKFLFEEHNDFSLGELSGHMECMETGSESDCSAFSTPSPCSAPSTPSPCNSAVHSPACQTPPSPSLSSSTSSIPTPMQSPQPTPMQQSPQLSQSTPLPSPMSSPAFVKSNTSNITLPPRIVGPSAQAVAASIASPAFAQTQDTHAFSQQETHAFSPHETVVHQATFPQEMHLNNTATSVPVFPLTAPNTAPHTNLTEMMMSEMMSQNKRLESIMLTMNTEMQSLKQELTQLRSNTPTGSALMTTKVDKMNGPATAIWTVSDGLLIEHNQKFAQLLDLMEVPKGYSMQHFFGGPCSKAASARMNHHLDNIKNAQPVTDYAVIERKRISGEVMRLMIVVNVVPTNVPVFITTMYEL